MNGKQYIGRRVSRYESYGQTRAVDGIALVVDEEHEYRAGDMTGYMMEIDCPYGTQAMADALLTQLGGRSYPGYTAENAVMDPAAELGDGVTVKGTYSLLASRQMTLGSGHLGQISAPAEGELDHEYAVEEPTMRQIERKLAQARSYIDKTSEEIKIGVEGMQGDVAELKVSVGSISSTVSGYDGRLSVVEQTATSLSSTVSGLEGRVSRIEQTENDITLSVTGSLGGTAYIRLSNGSGGSIDMSDVRQSFADDDTDVTISGGTLTFNGGGITFNSNTLVCNSDNLTIDRYGNLTARRAHFIGGAWCEGTMSAQDIILGTGTGSVSSYTLYGGLEFEQDVPLVYASKADYLFSGKPCAVLGYECNVAINCGNDYTIKMTKSPVYGSDRDIKKDIAQMDEKFVRLVDEMSPVVFRYRGESEDKPLHSGYIAQEMEAAMERAGMTRVDVAALDGQDGTGNMSIGYAEIVPMLHLKIKQLERRIKVLEGAA